MVLISYIITNVFWYLDVVLDGKQSFSFFREESHILLCNGYIINQKNTTLPLALEAANTLQRISRQCFGRAIPALIVGKQ